MKLLLGTTYFLPVIGIAVKNLPKDAPLQLIQKGRKIFISKIHETTILHTAFKLKTY